MRLIAVCMIATFLGAFSLLGSAAASTTQAVAIVDFAFQPAVVRADINSTITWTNTGNAPHTVTFDNGTVASGTLAPGQSFSVTLPVGHYSYFCSIHRSMTGTIDIQAVPVPPTLTPRLWLPLSASGA